MSKKKLIMLVGGAAALLILGGGGIIAYKMFSKSSGAPAASEEGKAKEGEAKETKEAKKEEGSKEGGKEGARKEEPLPNVNMGPTEPMTFVVNLADPGRPRFLKVNMEVETENKMTARELEALKPRVRDALITLLSSKSTAELVTVGDKERLKTEILHRLNSLVSSGKVMDVYFTEFMVQ